MISLLWLVAVLALSFNAKAAYPYNFPAYSKVKITRDPKGQSWLYLEFMWGKELKSAKNAQELAEIKKWNALPCHKPNFENGKAVEFEIGILPKCFLQPKGGMDDRFDCKDVMGDFEIYFNLPNNFIPSINAYNCYVDVWNYWNPSMDEVVKELHDKCGLDSSGDLCAKFATSSGAFLDPIGNFAVGLHDASALKAGIRYSFRYPVEVNNSPECLDIKQTFPEAKKCASDPLVMEDQFVGYYKPANIFTYLPKELYPNWGRAQVTMQTFNNKCDLPAPCDWVDKAYTCPHLLGVATNLGECKNVNKHTDFWLSKLCVPTGDYEFTPGVMKAPGHEGECMNELTSTNLDTKDECCVDLDGDGFFANSSSYLYGSRAGDCNDSNAAVNPAAKEVCGDGLDNDCDGEFKNICFNGWNTGENGDPCGKDAECQSGNKKQQSCGNGGTQTKVCTEECKWGQWGTCQNSGDCSPGQQQTCGNCGTMTCGGNYKWGTCQNQGVCTPNQQQSCGNCGTKTCSLSCGWGTCQNQGVCTPNQQLQQSCNSVGTQTKTCDNNCNWGSWNTCSAVCIPGQKQQQSCLSNGQQGTQERTCNGNGQWDNWGSCISNCVCSSGTCCDGCNYKSAANSCYSYIEYKCAGNSPGDDVQTRQNTKYCSGSSPSCSGQTSYGNWTTYENCLSNEVCSAQYNPPQCVPTQPQCADVYIASASSACYGNPQGSGSPTLCLYVQKVSGANWKYKACRQSGTFQNKFTYQLRDANQMVNFITYSSDSGVSCIKDWQTFNVSYIPGYGVINGAGVYAEIISPEGCKQSSCKYKTGEITIRKECQ